jgi:hypothetical protein
MIVLLVYVEENKVPVSVSAVGWVYIPVAHAHFLNKDPA